MSSTFTEINIRRIRNEFPTLDREVHGKDLIYLDNGATSQKPQAVIDRINKYYEEENANIHRGVHFLSQYSTEQYELARKKVQNFINAEKEEEIIFTSGTTDSINLVANTFGKKYFKEGSEVIISTMEHHSNIVPWQMICELTGATLKVIPITDNGELMMDEFKSMVNEKTAFISVTHVSNTLGTINPVKEIIDFAHERNIPVLLDGAQAVPHMRIDAQDLAADFYAFSAHKMYGPTGVGILYGKEKFLEDLPPYRGGGDMTKSVSFEKTVYNDLPHKFEAGTPNIAGGIGLGAAIDYMESLGLDKIANYENELLEYATPILSSIDGFNIIGEAQNKAAVISFLVDGTHPYDLGTLLDQMGIAIRTGHHCTEPLMNRFEIPGTARASFAFYNTTEEIDYLFESLNRAINMLR